jgi:hypothetical protein
MHDRNFDRKTVIIEQYQRLRRASLLLRCCFCSEENVSTCKYGKSIDDERLFPFGAATKQRKQLHITGDQSTIGMTIK